MRIILAPDFKSTIFHAKKQYSQISEEKIFLTWNSKDYHSNMKVKYRYIFRHANTSKFTFLKKLLQDVLQQNASDISQDPWMQITGN